MKIVKRGILVILAVLLAGVYAYGVWPRAIYDTNVGSLSFEVTEALTGNMVLEQRFTCNDAGLNGVSLKLTKQSNEIIGDYDWTVREAETDNIVGKGILNEASTENDVFNSSSPQKNGTVLLNFERQEDSANKEYIFTLQAKDVKEDQSMAVYITQKGNVNSTLTVDGAEKEQTGVIKIQFKRFNVETFIVFLGIIVYLVVFVKFMYKLFK